MRFPVSTPRAPRAAVLMHVWLRRAISTLAISLLTFASTTVIAMAFLIIDRWVEWPASWRAPGPWLAGGAALTGVVWLLAWWILYCPRPGAIAARLDHAVPGNQDRWATAIDLAARRQRGEAVGAPALVDRLFTQSHASVPWRVIWPTVSRRTLSAGLIAVSLVIMIVALIALSGAFNLPLLWQRFVDPYGNHPRDSFTRIRILSANGTSWKQDTLDPIPEGSAFELVIAIDRASGFFYAKPKSLTAATTRPAAPPSDDDGDPPVLEVVTKEGLEQRALARRDGTWVYALPRLATPIRFRIRAGDGLTEYFDQDTIRRIRMESVVYSASLPKYTRMTLPARQSLAGKRLVLLADTRVEFEVACDSPLAEFEPAFEVVQRSEEKKAMAALSRQDLLSITKGAPKAAIGPKRRVIPWQRVDERTARFRMDIEETGILRLRATGANGISGDDMLCLVEAVPDTPPKIVITGIEQDTTIIPGETVAVQFRAEDDFAVNDLVLNWKTGGTVATEDWVGEDVIHAPDIGKRVVTGQELIQRMKYPVLEARPFEFQLVATDSKGQEAQSGKFRIHIYDEDYAVRVERGVQRLASLESIASAYRLRMVGLENQLNVVAATAGAAKSWPADKTAVLEKYLAAVAMAGGPAVGAEAMAPRYTTIPARIDRSLTKLLAAARLAPSGADVLPVAKELATTADLPTSIERLRERIRLSVKMADLWAAAVTAERVRFTSELLLHRAQKLDLRIEALMASRSNAAYFKANAPFYIKQSAELLTATQQQQERIAAPSLTPLLLELATVTKGESLDAIAPVLKRVVTALRREHSGRPEAMHELLAHVRTVGCGDATRSSGVSAELAYGLGKCEQFAAGAVAAAAMDAWMPDGRTDPLMAAAESNPMDVLLLIEQLRGEVVGLRAALWAGRYSGAPQARNDREAELRELAMFTDEVVSASSALSADAKARVASCVMRLAESPMSELLADPMASDAILDDLSDQSKAILPAALASADRIVTLVGPALVARANELAARLRQHAEAITAFAQRPGRTPTSDAPDGLRLANEARALGREIDTLESVLRAVTQAHAMSRLSRSGPHAPVEGWESWERWVGSGVLIAGVMIRYEQELIDGHFGRGRDPTKWGQLIAETNKSAVAIVTELSAAAASMEGAMSGQTRGGSATGGGGGYAAVAERLGARSHVSWARSTFDALPAIVGPTDTSARADVRERVGAWPLASVARGERGQAWLVHTRASAALATTRPARHAVTTLAPRLEALAATGGPTGDSDLREAAQAALRMLPAQAREMFGTIPEGDAERQRQLSALDHAIDAVITKVGAGLQLPTVRGTRLGARLHSTTAMSIAQHERRVATMARESDLSLQREIWERLLPPPPVEWSLRDDGQSTDGAATAPAASRPGAPIAASTAEQRLSLVATLARSLEMRSRGLVFERRVNRGVDVAGGEEAMMLALPRHIVDELLRARNRKSPEDFKGRIEAYYADLQKDFAR